MREPFVNEFIYKEVNNPYLLCTTWSPLNISPWIWGAWATYARIHWINTKTEIKWYALHIHMRRTINPFATEGTLFPGTVAISRQKRQWSKIITHYLMHFICGIFRYISLGIGESWMGKFLGIPQIIITMTKQYAAICGKYSNSYRNQLK